MVAVWLGEELESVTHLIWPKVTKECLPVMGTPEDYTHVSSRGII